MSSENSYQVVKTLDNMPRILFWTVDEFSILIIPIFCGIAFGSILMSISGPILKYFYSKAKKKYPRGALMHRAYWLLPKILFKQSGVLKKSPGSHQRELLL